MRAIIIGAGKIGYHIAQVLARENHDVVLIEMNEERIKAMEDTLDIQVIIGSGTSYRVLEEAGAKEADLLVAVTEVDEVNMISCVIAKQYGVDKTVARVRNQEYIMEKKYQGGLFSDIDLVINPEMETAREIAKLIEVPEAQDVVYYANGMVQLLELQIPETATVIGTKLKDLKADFSYLIVAILRNGKMLIPRGDDRIEAEDIVFVMAKLKEMIKVEQLLGMQRLKTSKVMIIGANLAGLNLAKLLEDMRIQVKLIEKQHKRGREVAQQLKNTIVIHGDGMDLDLLKSEGIEDIDVFVCLTDDDKLNLLAGLLAKHYGAKRVIAQVRQSDYVALMESVGIDVGISPRLLTAESILRFIKRGRGVISVTLLCDERAEMLEVILSEGSRVVNKKIKELNFPQGAIIGSIMRKNDVLIATGDDILQVGDMISVFVLPQALRRVEEYLDII